MSSEIPKPLSPWEFTVNANIYDINDRLSRIERDQRLMLNLARRSFPLPPKKKKRKRKEKGKKKERIL